MGRKKAGMNRMTMALGGRVLFLSIARATRPIYVTGHQWKGRARQAGQVDLVKSSTRCSYPMRTRLLVKYVLSRMICHHKPLPVVIVCQVVLSRAQSRFR